MPACLPGSFRPSSRRIELRIARGPIRGREPWNDSHALVCDFPEGTPFSLCPIRPTLRELGLYQCRIFVVPLSSSIPFLRKTVL